MLSTTLRRTLAISCTLALGAVGSAGCGKKGAPPGGRTPLMVYTALENDQLSAFKAAIEGAVPEAEVTWLRDSTGVITARLIAEKATPRADVIVGLAVTSVLLLEGMNLLEAYKPAGADNLRASFRDASEPYAWTGMGAYLSVVCVNTAEVAKEKLTSPASWLDLTKSELKGKVVMPHPASSGTGYIAVAGWLQSMGEEKGWAYMDRLHENVAVYTHSGSAPCVQAAKGERTIGIGADVRGITEKRRGAPVDLVVPADGAGWEIEAAALLRGSKNAAVARKVIDFLASKPASELYARASAVVAHPDVRAEQADLPKGVADRLVRNDFAWMARERERILAEWSRRYEGKAAPRN